MKKLIYKYPQEVESTVIVYMKMKILTVILLLFNSAAYAGGMGNDHNPSLKTWVPVTNCGPIGMPSKVTVFRIYYAGEFSGYDFDITHKDRSYRFEACGSRFQPKSAKQFALETSCRFALSGWSVMPYGGQHIGIKINVINGRGPVSVSTPDNRIAINFNVEKCFPVPNF
jgi:hypothetical protein